MKLKIKHLREWFRYCIYMYDRRTTVMIGMTNFCQCSCPHCGMALYRKKKEEEMSKDEIMEIINQLPKNKIKGVYFFGGEPLLRNDIFELINCARRRGFITFLDTNGYLLTKETVSKLKGANLRVIGVSIDSPYANVHNKLRGLENSFEKALAGIKSCLNEKIICYLSTYATKENIENGDLEKLILLGEKLGVNYVRILFPLSIGGWLDKKDKTLNDRERQLLKRFRRLGFIKLEGYNCPVMIKRFFYISPYGEVQPCCYIPFSFGNIRKETLEKILERMWKHPMFKIKTKDCPIDNKEFYEKYISKITQSSKLPTDLSNYEN